MVTSSGGSKPPAHAALARFTPTAARFASVTAHEAPPAEESGVGGLRRRALSRGCRVLSAARQIGRPRSSAPRRARVPARLPASGAPRRSPAPAGCPSGTAGGIRSRRRRSRGWSTRPRPCAIVRCRRWRPSSRGAGSSTSSITAWCRSSAARAPRDDSCRRMRGTWTPSGACGMAAITVSGDGERVAGRFGMRRTGTIVVEGCEEGVFTRRGSG